MLLELAVTDLGVIEELTLVLGPGMTAVTGETGAGKTLVVTAIDLLVVGRADALLVAPGRAEATVEGRFVAGEDYSIADMASYPWTVGHERQGQKLADFPNLERWFRAIEARPATIRAYEIGQRHQRRETPMDEEAKKILFGQTAAVLKR